MQRTGNSGRLRTFLQQLNRFGRQSLWVVAVDRHQHVLWLQIGVNNLALAVQVGQTFEYLFETRAINQSILLFYCGMAERRPTICTNKNTI